MNLATRSLSLLAATLLAATASAQERIDLDTAVARALAQTPGLAAAHARQEAADAQADSLRGRLLPGINVSEEYQHYTEPFSVQFGPTRFEARKQDTNVFVVAAQQPLLGLLHLTQDQSAARTSAEAAAQQAQAVEAAVREQVSTGYLRYFEARALIETAKASEAQLAEQRNLADARLRAGVITQADALRIATALANAKLQEANAQAQADATRASLLVVLGYPPDAPAVELVEPKELVEQAPKLLEEPAVQRDAAQRRPEAKAAALLQEAAQKQQQGRLFALLPEVNLEAAYVKINGQTFASPEDKYVGVKATWPIFSWGADYYAYQASSAQARAQAQQAEDQVRNVRIDATGKLAQLRAASAAVELSQTAIQSAEEAYRVTNAQVKAGVATSTSDLLDAESALTSARLSLVRAKYERAIAAVALRRATGG